MGSNELVQAKKLTRFDYLSW